MHRSFCLSWAGAGLVPSLCCHHSLASSGGRLPPRPGWTLPSARQSPLTQPRRVPRLGVPAPRVAPPSLGSQGSQRHQVLVETRQSATSQQVELDPDCDGSRDSRGQRDRSLRGAGWAPGGADGRAEAAAVLLGRIPASPRLRGAGRPGRPSRKAPMSTRVGAVSAGAPRPPASLQGRPTGPATGLSWLLKVLGLLVFTTALHALGSAPPVSPGPPSRYRHSESLLPETSAVAGAATCVRHQLSGGPAPAGEGATGGGRAKQGCSRPVCSNAHKPPAKRRLFSPEEPDTVTSTSSEVSPGVFFINRQYS